MKNFKENIMGSDWEFPSRIEVEGIKKTRVIEVDGKYRPQYKKFLVWRNFKEWVAGYTASKKDCESYIYDPRFGVWMKKYKRVVSFGSPDAAMDFINTINKNIR